MIWNIYLSGEIHSDWRQELISGDKSHDLPVEFTSTVTNHEASDAAGERWSRLFGQFGSENKVESHHGYAASLITGPA